MTALSTTDRTELEQCEAAIETGLTSAYGALVTIRDRQLYRETHESFEAYCQERWGFSRRRAYQLIEAAHVVGNLCTTGTHEANGTRRLPNERQARALAELPASEQPAAWKEAVEESGGKPTAKAVQAVVDRKLGKPPKPAPVTPPGQPPNTIGHRFGAGTVSDPDPEPERKARVNGVAQADPPDVAALRAAGKIPAGAVVEVIEPEGGETLEDVRNDHAEAAGKADDLSDEEWLATLPLSSVLADLPLRKFSADALHFRRLEPMRRDFANRVVRVKPSRLAADGLVHFRTRNYIRMDHPKDWVRCPDTENGGCGGSGEVMMIGQCAKCRGRGYRINV